jgi:hypothetical protein
MASLINAALCALVGAAFWTALGYAIARHVLPRVLALGAAPVIGWAVFSAATLPILSLIGFSPLTIVSLAALALLIAAVLLSRPPPALELEINVTWRWLAAAAIAAAILALAPAMALTPKYSQVGVHLATPMFDHAKIAFVDAMMRQGVPPVNAVFGAVGAGGVERLTYYYLWHFSAAELGLPLHVSGWEADIGLTCFTAFASLSLMMALAVWLSKRTGAAILVVVLAASASLRAVLAFIFGDFELQPFLQRPNGFAGWLFQSAWVPQHLMAASAAIVAMLLLAHYTQRPKLGYVLTLALIVTASFESSAYVGGVIFALAAAASAPLVLLAADKKRRLAVASGLGLSAVLALGLAAPFLRDQLATVAARGGGGPIAVEYFAVLGEIVPPTLRGILDLPAYWLILLPLELPATFIAGTISLIVLLRHAPQGSEKMAVALLGVLTAVGLLVSWLLASRLGDNNDLGLRAILPAAMILIVSTAVGAVAAPRLRVAIATIAGVGVILSLPGSAEIVYANWRGNSAADEAVFAQSPELWRAVRRYAAADARIANNPLFLRDLTSWPGNMSWALLADRSSCFAGREMALVAAPLPPERREAINDQFIRVFAGQARPNDVGDLAAKYGCDVTVVVPQDGAWTNDPFAASADYRLAESRDDRWRIYVKVRSASAGK